MSLGTFTRYPLADPLDPSADQLVDVFVQAEWISSRQTRTVAHQLLQDDRSDYTLLPPEPRAGTMTLRFPDAATAHAAADFFADPAEYHLYPINPEVCSARFVVHGGQIVVAQTGGGHRSWTVSLPWREVTP